METKVYQQLIIGTGFAGLCAAIQLKKAGETNFILLERNDKLGGTWYDNQYPGAACDVESHLYSFSFEPNVNWSRQFSPQQEILNYMNQCADRYDLHKHIRYNHTVSLATFNETDGTWQVLTELNEVFTTKILISCSGGLSEPSYPNIKGLDTFKGKIFHTAKWDASYNISGKTVAVIGTGASAVQLVPAIAPQVKQLNLFQRTPPWILPKPDKEISSFRKWMYRNLPFMQTLHRIRLYWSHEIMAYAFIKQTSILKLAGKLALLYLKRSVKDETLRKKLTPTYTLGCKRVLLSNDYFPAMQRSNVSVISDAITEVNETGIRTKNGIQHTADVLVLATGFQAAEGVSRFDVKGRNGADLNQSWQHGAEAYLGTHVAGFPNLFFIVGPNTGLGHSSVILMIEAQVNLVMQSIKAIKKDKLKFIDIKASVQQKYNADLQEKLSKTVWQTGGCTSWYQMQNGKNVTLWPSYTFKFMQQTKKFKAENYELVPY